MKEKDDDFNTRNKGERWTEKDEAYLLSSVTLIKTDLIVLKKELGRTASAILQRLYINIKPKATQKEQEKILEYMREYKYVYNYEIVEKIRNVARKRKKEMKKELGHPT